MRLMARRTMLDMPSAPAAVGSVSEPPQRIRFCRGADGVRLAFAAHGSGPPLLVVSCWLSHLQHDWQSPVWRHFLDELGRATTLIRYDERGFGLSDWTVSDFSLAARVADLEAIVDELGLEQLSLLGMSGGSPVAMAFAAAHPERVERLIIYGGSPLGRRTAAPTERELAFRAMIRAGWAQEDPLFRRVFTNVFIPGASEEQMGWFDELQRMSTSTDNAVDSRVARQEVDITDRLPRIAAPTLVLHARGDLATPLDDARLTASLIPDARLVVLESRNHILLADEPAWGAFMEEVTAFVAPATATEPSGDGLKELSVREREILRLAAEGRSNAQIAEALVLSVRTVERHLSNAYLKLGISGRTARTAAVASLLRSADA
jgi:pimeloyl-ACP methyl ester carboxylesterase/DNA-binding CsgD family transcriptional regulator